MHTDIMERNNCLGHKCVLDGNSCPKGRKSLVNNRTKKREKDKGRKQYENIYGQTWGNCS